MVVVVVVVVVVVNVIGPLQVFATLHSPHITLSQYVLRVAKNSSPAVVPQTQVPSEPAAIKFPWLSTAHPGKALTLLMKSKQVTVANFKIISR